MSEYDPTGITERYKKFVSALRDGNHITAAMVYAGLSKSELRVLRRDDDINREIEEAGVYAEVHIVQALTRAAVEGNTDAARWFLERRNTAAWTSEKDRKAIKLAMDKWKEERRIIRAELESDPAMAALMLKDPKQAVKAKQITAAPQESVVDAEVVEE